MRRAVRAAARPRPPSATGSCNAGEIARSSMPARRDEGAPKNSNSNAPRNEQLPNIQPSAGLRIILHGTSQLNQNAIARNAFIVAANRWEAIISTPVTVVLDVDFGTTFFGTPFPS